MATTDRPKGEDQLVLALAGGQTVRDAAQQAGVSERTAHRRLEDEAFRHRVAAARTAMHAQAVGRLAEAGVEAVKTLVALLNADSESVKLSAARSILELGPKLRETTELAERIEQLEAQRDAASPGVSLGR